MHFASHYRWSVYRHLFGSPPPADMLLDLGSDDGGFVARMPARLSVALDRALSPLRKAPADLRVCADGTQLPFRGAIFDHVVLSDVIEHVENDELLVSSVTRHLRQGGVLWLSTTASDFTLFPRSITPRAERSWGHVRKGYTPARLRRMIGDDFECRIVEWPEFVFRHLYALIWLCSKRFPGAARWMATICFAVDSRLPPIQPRSGHIYIYAVRLAR